MGSVIRCLWGMQGMATESHKEGALKQWLPVLTLSMCTFIFNTSEFIPIGLLVDIGNDFGITEAQTGSLVTAYAWVVALMSLPLMLLASKMELRRLMLLVVGVFFVSHIFSGLSTNYWMLLASRIGVACSHAIFWSIVSPLAVEVAPARRRSTALSMVVVGSSIAMIFGLPLGRILGLWLGWRMTFMTIAAIAALVLFCLYRIFPAVKSKNAVALSEVPALLTRRALLGIYIMTPIVMTGNFTLYSYIEPFLAQVGGLSEEVITWTLVVYGSVGLLTSWLFSRYFDRKPAFFIAAALIGITASLLLVKTAAVSVYTVYALCVLWGLCVTSYNLAFQASIIVAAPTGTAVAMSVFSGIYNIGIGSGALVGGLVITHLGMEKIGYVGSGITALGALWGLLFVLPAVLAAFATQSRRTKAGHNAD